MSRFSVKIVWSHTTETFGRWTFLFFRKYRAAKNLMHQRVISRFCFGFVLLSTKKLCRGTVLCLTKTPPSKYAGRGRVVVSRLSVETVFSPGVETFRRRTILCFKKFRVSQKFMHENRISQFPVEKFLSQSTRKLRRGTLLCFRKTLMSENFMDEKVCLGREGV